MTQDYYARTPLERTAVLKGDRIRCDGSVQIRGESRKCGQVLVEIVNHDVPKKAVLQCRRCGKRHLI